MTTTIRRVLTMLVLAAVCLFGSPAIAAQMLAVLELSGALPADQRRALTDAIRQEATIATRSAGMKVMTQENMEVLLSEMGVDASCLSEGSCEVDTFRNLQARYGITGKVTDFAGTYVVTLQLYDVKAAALMDSKTVDSKNPLELMKTGVPGATRELVSLLPGVSVASVAAPTRAGSAAVASAVGGRELLEGKRSTIPSRPCRHPPVDSLAWRHHAVDSKPEPSHSTEVARPSRRLRGVRIELERVL